MTPPPPLSDGAALKLATDGCVFSHSPMARRSWPVPKPQGALLGDRGVVQELLQPDQGIVHVRTNEIQLGQESVARLKIYVDPDRRRGRRTARSRDPKVSAPRPNAGCCFRLAIICRIQCNNECGACRCDSTFVTLKP